MTGPKLHVQINCVVEDFQCPSCDRSFNNKGLLRLHKRVCGTAKVNTTHEEDRYCCTLCSRKGFNIVALKEHRRLHHGARA